jgi:hypothetical protein
MTRQRYVWALVTAIVSFVWAASSSADSLELEDFLTAMDISPEEVAATRKGEIITGSTESSHERELVATLVFLIRDANPTQIVKLGEEGLLEAIDENTIVFSLLPDEPNLESFRGLQLREEDVAAFRKAAPGDALNLSAEEIDAFEMLGEQASAEQIEEVVREIMLARVLAYKAKGLDGIAPYQRSAKDTRSPAEDLRSATLAGTLIKKVAPDAYQLLLDYPASRPPGTKETFRWAYIEAHGEPTIVLTHNLYVPEGDAWMVTQRQFYASRGYNCEQAISAFVPVTEGTAVFYINRTSTDQVSGFGGGAKRSIGGKLLASELEALLHLAGETVSNK